MIKNWTNTHFVIIYISITNFNLTFQQGAQQQKLKAREKRLKDEENARIFLDIEEEKLKAKERKEIIAKAKLKLYYNTDKVKNLHVFN